MHRSFSNFRQFSLRGLLAAGAVASLGLPLGREAEGIGGSFIQPTYTPRETVGAAPTTSLIGASSSSASSTAAAASADNAEAPPPSGGTRRTTRHVSSDDEGHGTTAKRRQRKKEKSGTTAVVDNSKDSKDHKQTPPPLVAAAPGPQFSISAGYETRYIYHGLDIISFNTLPALTDRGGLSRNFQSSGIAYTNADVTYQGLHLGVEYLNSVSRVIPYLQAINSQGAFIGNLSKKYYDEVDINLDYTVAIVANILDATLGYDSFIIPNNDFKGTNYQGELLFRLAYKQIPYVTPNFTFYHDFSLQHNDTVGNLNGSLVEFRLDGTVPIIKKENFALTFAPYVSSIYNINYLNYTGTRDGNVGGISSLQTGIRLPLTIAKHFTITPYGNYGMDLTPTQRNAAGLLDRTPIDNFTGNGFGERTHFWGGVTVTYSF